MIDVHNILHRVRKPSRSINPGTSDPPLFNFVFSVPLSFENCVFKCWIMTQVCQVIKTFRATAFRNESLERFFQLRQLKLLQLVTTRMFYFLLAL